MTESMTAAYAVDERVSEYFKYNHIDKFYDLTFEEMEKASAVVSEVISKGNDTGYANDENRIYYYDVDENDSKNYKITDFEEIDVERKNINVKSRNEAELTKNNGVSLSTRTERDGRNGNNITIENSRTYQRNDGMAETERTSNSQRNDSKGITNTWLIEDSKKSSFFNENKPSKEEIINNIYKNVQNRTSKDNQKNNQRIETYLEQKYPQYKISFTNYKSDGTVTIDSIETLQEFEDRAIATEKENQIYRQQTKELLKKEKYKTTQHTY